MLLTGRLVVHATSRDHARPACQRRLAHPAFSYVAHDATIGDPLRVSLWRIDPEEFSKLRLKVLSYSEDLAARLPGPAKEKVAAAKASRSLDEVVFEVKYVQQMVLKP